jgi:hypothetical protein
MMIFLALANPGMATGLSIVKAKRKLTFYACHFLDKSPLFKRGARGDLCADL